MPRLIEQLESRTHLSADPVARPAYNTGSGFFVLNGKVYDSNGYEFVMKGPNTVHAWGSYNTAYNTIDQVAKTGANAARLVMYRDIPMDSGNPWTDAADTVAERKETVERYLANGIVPIVEDHASIADGGSVQSNASALNQIVTHWLENASWLKQYEQYIILNIANEWGPMANANGSNTGWRDAYITQVARLRAGPDGNIATTADNINCAIMIDSGQWGQDLYTIEHHADDILASDPQRNIIFSIHLYGSWRDESRAHEISTNPTAGWGPWDINTRLSSWQNRVEPLAIVIGEWAWEDFKDFSNTSAPYGAYRTRRVMEIADNLGIGWFGWSWNQSSPNTLNMTTGVSNFQYNTNTDLSAWGNTLVNDPDFGWKANAKRATFFPVAGLPGPTTGGLPALPGSAPSDTWIVIEKTQISAAEGGQGAARVRLSKAPAGNVTVNVNKVSGDADLSAVTTSLTFTPDNWNEYQPALIAAAADANATMDTAKFQLSSAGLVSNDFVVKEIEPPAAPSGNSFTLFADRDRLLSPATSGTATSVSVNSTFYTTEGNPNPTNTFFLRFPLTAVAGKITNAVLRLYTTNTTANLRARVFAVLGDTWQESSGTGTNSVPIYAAYPLFDGTNNTGTLLPTTGGSYVDFNIGALRDFASAEHLTDGVVSVAVRMVSGSATFQTDEGANRPQLVLTTGEAISPNVLSSNFDFSTANHAVRIGFSEDIAQSLATGDLAVTNLTNPSATFSVNSASFDIGSNTASFTFAPGVLPDGRYTARLSAGSVADVNGNLLLSSSTFDFFYLQGDINADAIVNINDFSILASRFNQSGTYAEGDINYDGTIGIGDFAILASKFNVALPAARGIVPITTEQRAAVTPRLFSDRSVASASITNQTGNRRIELEGISSFLEEMV